MPSVRGTYTEAMTGAIAAFRANQQHHIVQVFDLGTGTIMADAGVTFDPASHLSSVVSDYTDSSGP